MAFVIHHTDWGMEFFTDEVMRDLLAQSLETAQLGTGGFTDVGQGPGSAEGALNGLAAAQIVDILGDARPGADRLLVTGAAGAVGAYVAALAPDRGWRVTVRPNAVPTTERGITASVVDTRPDAPRLEELLARAASGELPARVHAVVPLDQAVAAQRAMAKGRRARSLRPQALTGALVRHGLTWRPRA